MTTITGTTSMNQSHYDYILKVSTTEDNAHARYKVTVTAYIRTIRYKFISWIDHECVIAINGKAHKKNFNGLSSGDNRTVVDTALFTVSEYIPYSAAKQTISITSETDLVSSGGWGPGHCAASGSVSIPLKLSTAGSLNFVHSSESSIKAKLSGVSKAPYRRTIKWYRKLATAKEWTYVETDHIAANRADSVVTVARGLLSNRAYNIKAVIIHTGSGTIITSKTCNGRTQKSSGMLDFMPGTTYIRVTAGALSQTTRLKRYIQWYYKRAKNKKYTFYGESKEGKRAVAYFAKTIKKLGAGVKYNVKAVLKDGASGQTLKTMTGTTTTLKKSTNQSASAAAAGATIPTGVIEYVEQIIPTTNVRIYWDAPDDCPGSKYRLRYKVGNAEVADTGKIIATLADPPAEGYTEASLDIMESGNGEYTFWIESSNNSDRSGTWIQSDMLTVNLYTTFEWATPKVAGEAFDLTASEWNWLREWMQGKLTLNNLDIESFEMTEALPEDPVENEMFNQILRAIQACVSDFSMNEKSDGDAISAADLVALRNGANS